ncbi:NCS1 family nucleobase:cation symporter-1 [Parashewanella spongiae]|uniref:NCS1 family nucleobase:cation symporter-1 n=1 Tax=Parashewanella spongiae TaxID=342950 RepID=A0A3A6U8Y2_9GAMM|nr:NCS1 family nucleobase:cation symporter-1 [Parashewanella spongiae]MCL1077460.1 NCS1 family nucleobase:cation symporter-1 [Parashewanella spongiae]RJY18401.1 NCS1 family nucleobase:cation symporter-1 [Parashewanella spongiae]
MPSNVQYDPRLYNEDLAPISGKQRQSWNWYNIFAFWMADIHSVGGYIFAASLFTLGMEPWLVFVGLITSVVVVMKLTNLMAKPSQKSGIPFPVVCRLAFGVLGANIPAMIRGIVATVWYGIQTYLASVSLQIMLLHVAPQLSKYTEGTLFAGLHSLGWMCFIVIWLLQMILFWRGIETIKRFVDFAGPAVYAVMLLLVYWIVTQAGWENIDFNLASKNLSAGQQCWQLVISVSLVVSYFLPVILNFGDFARYATSFRDILKGNLLGILVNFVFFSVITVVITAGTIPVFGQLILDPLETVARIDSFTAVLFGALTFITATLGINIVANFVSSAFDFSNLQPNRLNLKTAGMITALLSACVTPWNLFNNPQIIHYTIDLLAAFMGPVLGIVITDFYLIKKQRIVIAELYHCEQDGKYWYFHGFNRTAILSLSIAALISILFVLLPEFAEKSQWHGLMVDLSNFSGIFGAMLASACYKWLSTKPSKA